MNGLKPISQTKLFGLEKYLNELIKLEILNKLPSKFLFSGQKGIGKSTLAYHFINYVLSKDENLKYDNINYQINPENHSFKTVKNFSNPNLMLIDIKDEKFNIDINQIRDLISTLNKSSFNQKPRFILIDNIEFLNINSINALLKVLEEPPANVYFILINNCNKKIIPTLLSRCVNFRFFLSNSENLDIANKLLDGDLNRILNNDLINYYSSPGDIYKLAKFVEKKKYDLSNLDLKKFLIFVIEGNDYKKDIFLKNLIFNYIESYLIKLNLKTNFKIFRKYNYFIKKIAEVKRFNLDEESLFIEFNDEILNG